MVVSTAQLARSTTARLRGAPRGRRAAGRRAATAGRAVWVPNRVAPAMTCARAARLFADDRRLIRLKLLALAGIVIAAAVLDRAV